MNSGAGKAIFWGGFIAGILDGLDAIIFFGLTIGSTPRGIFRHIASGLIGPSARSGGAVTIALGVVLHFSIAFGAAAVYYAVSRLLPILLTRPWLSGSIFGIGLHFFMQTVVVPLSLVPKRTRPITALETVNELLIHALGVGLPIAWAVTRYARTVHLKTLSQQSAE